MTGRNRVMIGIAALVLIGLALLVVLSLLNTASAPQPSVNGVTRTPTLEPSETPERPTEQPSSSPTPKPPPTATHEAIAGDEPTATPELTQTLVSPQPALTSESMTGASATEVAQ